MQSSRRNFLKVLGAGTAITALQETLFPRFLLPSANATPVAGLGTRFLIINLAGGCDSDKLCTRRIGGFYDAYLASRPNVATPEQYLLTLGNTSYAVHHRLQQFKNSFDLGELAVIQKTGIIANQSGSHEEAEKDFAMGVADGRAEDTSGWIQRLAQSQSFSDAFNVVDRTGGHPTVLGGAYQPTVVNNFSELAWNNRVTGENSFRLNTSLSLIHDWQGTAQEAAVAGKWRTVEDSVDKIKTALNTPTNPAFPLNTDIGRQLADVFRAFANFTTRVAYVRTGGFDVHGDADPVNQYALGVPTMGMSKLLYELNTALSAFKQNMQAIQFDGASAWNNTVVLILSEFSRTNRENENAGLDHGGAQTCFVMGGPVKGGIYGEQPTAAEWNHARNLLIPSTNINTVYADILRYMGMSPSPVFPGQSLGTLGLF